MVKGFMSLKLTQTVNNESEIVMKRKLLWAPLVALSIGWTGAAENQIVGKWAADS
jgi:hypothetical protein